MGEKIRNVFEVDGDRPTLTVIDLLRPQLKMQTRQIEESEEPGRHPG